MPEPKPWRKFANWNFFRNDDRLLLILIALIVGVCSGLAALALNRSLAAILTWLRPYRNQVWAFVLPGIGAALSSLFLNKIVNEGAGHGGTGSGLRRYRATADCCAFAAATRG